MWGDTIDGDLSIVEGFFRDSSVLYSNAKNEFGFWKIGEKPRVVRKWKCESPCECNQAKYGRPWEKGNILLKMVQQNGCPYAVLDTATGVVKKLEFKGEFAWLDGCDDITYIDGDVVCLKRFDNAMGAVSLLNQKGVIDSLENTKERNFLGYSPILYGNFMLIQVYRKDLFATRIVTKINKKGFDSNYLEMLMSVNTFIDSVGNSISYSSEDLIVTK